ncbi:3-dehydroquinate dehydratase [alpha proteobacterium BAL199]|jgi:3-dehydroquinate dehydratase II|nr:3-dehydroquinate dehydratase [alpha proteobacterium BAL199]
MHEEARKYGQTLDIRYTNLEGEAIGWIYEAERGGTDGLLMNPAGFLYAGYALRDCIKAVSMPYVEVHMTNIDKRGMGVVTLTRRVSKLACRSLIKRHVPRISKLRTLRADGSEW